MTSQQKVLLGNIRGPAGPPGDLSTVIPLTQKGAANGVATLDGSSHVPATQLALAVLLSQLGAANGAASLDSSSHVPVAQLANAILATALGAANGAASLDSTGNVPLSELGNVPPAKQAWEFFPEDYGAVGHAKIATDVATSGGNTFTSAQMAANASVGMYVMIDGGRSPYPETAAIGTITAISGTSITINPVDSFHAINSTNTGLNALYGSDDTNAINSALDAARAWAEAHNYDADVLLTEGPYVIATNTQSNDGTALYNTAIKMPHPSNNNARKLVVSLKGRSRTDNSGYWNSSIPNMLSSSLVAMTIAPSSLDVTWDVQSVIATATPEAGMAGTISPTFVNTKAVVENVNVIVPLFSNLTGFDFRYSASVYADGCSVTAFATAAVGNGVHMLTYWGDAAWDFHPTGTAIRLPIAGNNADVFVPSFLAQGVANGVDTPSEHTVIGRLVLLYTQVALRIRGGNTGHGLVIGHVTAEGYQGGIRNSDGGSGNCPVFIGSWATETSASAYDIYDPGNALQGEIRWINNVDNRAIIVNGAGHLKIKNLSLNPGVWSGAPALPSSGTAMTNTAYRDAWVDITGGTVTAIAVNGVTIPGQTSGRVEVPSGDTIAITYSAAPTVAWHLKR